MNKFQLGGSIFNLESIAAAIGAGLTEGLINGSPRLGSAVVLDGTFTPATMAPPVGPILQNNMINQLWGNLDATPSSLQRYNAIRLSVHQLNSSINNSINKSANITTREVPIAQQGDKLPQIESNNARPLMGLFRHMIPGFNNAYKLKLYLAAYLLKLRQKFLSNLHKLPFMEPAVKADMNTYDGGQLPDITVEAVDLSKPQHFPYGGINVESKSVRGGLDRKQHTFVNPFDRSDLIAKHQEGSHIEKTDNTRVASGRPQQINNKIPYGAGKGPAGEGPMRLFNDPYVNMGLMAMAPMAVKMQSKNILAPTQIVESLPVPTNLTYGLLRLYKAAQLKGYKGTIGDFITLSSEILGTPQAMGSEGNKFYGYNLEKGNSVLYSRPHPENPKVLGLTVNEPARWQELLKKIIK